MVRVGILWIYLKLIKIQIKLIIILALLVESRVEMMVGRDFELDGYGSNPANLFIYPLLEVDDEVSKKFKKKFSYRNL